MNNYRKLFVWFFSMSCMSTTTSLNTLAMGQSMRDGEALVSSGGRFEVGFFSPGNSKGRYLGVWCRNISPIKVVWVANRETPISNSRGILKLNEKGILLLLNGKSSTPWSSNISGKVGNNPIAQILDSGNLVVKNEHDTNEDNFLWQSFDHPCDTILPGMKLGWNLVTGVNRFLSSWKSADDPAMGEYSVMLDLRGYPQAVGRKGSVIMTRFGSWNGIALSGSPVPLLNHAYEFVLNKKQVYFKYELQDRSTFSMHSLVASENWLRLNSISLTRNHQVITHGDADACENYNLCGPNSICYMNGYSQTCECMKGFRPKSPKQWNASNWSNGCVRKTRLDCSKADGFWRQKNMKLPDTSSSWYNMTIDLEECQKLCLKNCSCTSYANLDIRHGGSGCLLWFDDLIDMRQFPQVGQDLYIRLSASELAKGHGINKKKLLGMTSVVIIFGLATCVCLIILKKHGLARKIYRKHLKIEQWKEDIDSLIYDFPIIAKATENFSSNNKLGEGGFGAVYKGILEDGQEIAVKRLSRMSGQGLEELKTEAMLIAKLQHRNLVKLIGCCIKAEEKLLIYEYMPNKSLDYFIFDVTKRKLVDWHKRINIISGIARGLLYLHQDSRLRIVHRDLKISNILLDSNFDPKISDFGLARTFLRDEVEAHTNRVAGTYGYMPPEYAIRGRFSMKSDVFSYGVMLLEIVSGQKNREFSDPQHNHNLLGYAWKLWTEGRTLELLDELLEEQCIPSEVIRCIHVGLLCVQQRPEDRPNMSSVILMLNGDKLLPKPKVPGFYTERDETSETESLLVSSKMFSPNNVSTTMFEAR